MAETNARPRFGRRDLIKLLTAAAGATALAVGCAPAATPEPAKPADKPAAPAAPTTAPAAAAPTAAPAKPAEPTPAAAAKPASGQQTITYWVEFTDKLSNDTLTELVNGPFEKKFPQYKIQMTQTPDYPRQVQTAASAGALPDIFNHYGPSYAPPLAEGGYLMDLGPLAKQYGWEQKIFPWMLDACKFKSKLFCLPTEYESLHLFYNADMFKKNGWTPPKNAAELLALTKAQMDAKIIPFVFGSSGGVTRHEWWLSYAMNAYSGNLALYDALTGAKPWTDEVYVGAIDFLNKLWQSGAIMSKQTAAITHDDALAVWSKQEAAMIMDGTWRYRTAPTLGKDFKWDTAMLPSWRNEVKMAWPIGIGEVLCINSKAKNVEGAAEYANWFFQDPKEIGKWVTRIPGIITPPILMTKDDYAPDSNPILRDLYLDMIEKMKADNFGYLLWTSWPAKTDKWMYENIDAVFLGQMTPKQYMEKVNAQFQEEFKAGAVPQQPKPKQ